MGVRVLLDQAQHLVRHRQIEAVGDAERLDELHGFAGAFGTCEARQRLIMRDLAIGQISDRLIGDLDPDAWDLPPKPKWMRWATYNRYVQRFDEYEEMLDSASIASVGKRLGLKGL